MKAFANNQPQFPKETDAPDGYARSFGQPRKKETRANISAARKSQCQPWRQDSTNHGFRLGLESVHQLRFGSYGKQTSNHSVLDQWRFLWIQLNLLVIRFGLVVLLLTGCLLFLAEWTLNQLIDRTKSLSNFNSGQDRPFQPVRRAQELMKEAQEDGDSPRIKRSEERESTLVTSMDSSALPLGDASLPQNLSSFSQLRETSTALSDESSEPEMNPTVPGLQPVATMVSDTTDGLEGTPGASDPSSSQPGIAIPVDRLESLFRKQMPPPGSAGMPYFSGANVTEFLERYEETCEDYDLSEPDKILRVPRYCDSYRKDLIKALPEWKSKGSWAKLVKAMKSEFREHDLQQIRDSMTFLNEFVMAKRTPADLKGYVRLYTQVADSLVYRKVLSEVDQGRLFLIGLPQSVRDKVIKHFKVDDLDPDTYRNYSTFRDFVLKATKSEQTIQALQLQKEPTPAYTREIQGLVREQSTTPVVTEADKKKPVVLPFTTLTPSNDEVSKLAQRLESITLFQTNLASRVEKGEQLLRDRTVAPQHIQQGQVRPGYSEQDGRNNVDLSGSVSVNAISAYGGRTGSCIYCENKFNVEWHQYRDQCPIFTHHVQNQVVHLNDFGKYCVGPRRLDAEPLRKRVGQTWAGEVKLKTIGTEWDEDLDRRRQFQENPRNDQTTRSPAAYNPTPSTSTPSQVVQNPEKLNQGNGGRIINLIKFGGELLVDKEDDVEVNAVSKTRQPFPTRISKRTQREQDYGTLLNRATQESGTMVAEDPMDTQAEDTVEPEVVSEGVTITKRVAKPRVREKYIDPYTTIEKKKLAVDNFMEQSITIKIGDLVAMDASLNKLFNQKVPLVPAHGGNRVEIRDVPEHAVTPQEVFGRPPLNMSAVQNVKNIIRHCPSLAMKTPRVETTINNCVRAPAMIDCGAEVNIISKTTADAAKLTILNEKVMTFSTITGDRFEFAGYIKDVEVDIGGIKNHTDFFVVETPTQVLLGMPFILESQMSFKYPGEGLMEAVLYNQERKQYGSVLVAGDETEIEVPVKE